MEKEFESFLTNKGAKIYNNYGILEWNFCLHTLPEKPANKETKHHQRLDQQMESKDETFWTLLSNLWGRRGNNLASDSEI